MLAVVAVLVVVGPWPVSSDAAAARTSAFLQALSPATPTANSTTLSLSPNPIFLSPYFWGTTASGRADILPSEAQLMNATPNRVILFPGGSTGDEYDPFNNTLHSPKTGAISTALTSEAQFVRLCRAVNCSAILEVPGEIDNPQFAKRIVNYTENVLGFHPAYWEIGNEPELWKQWQVPWSQWPALQTVPRIGPYDFAHEVQAYVAAMRSVDSKIRVLGITATGRPNSAFEVGEWVNATVQVNGPNISGVAVHIYPAGACQCTSHGVNLSAFYAALNSPSGLPARISTIRANISYAIAQNWSSTPGLSIPVFVTEIGAALSHRQFGQYADTFAGGLDFAAQMTQAMALNVTNLDLYGSVFDTNNSWFSLTGTERPDYEVWSQLFTHLGPVAYPVTFSGYNHTLFGIATLDPADGTRSDLLVVNANTTTSVSFHPTMAGPTPTSTVHLWNWNGTVHLAPGTQTQKTNRNTSWVSPNTPVPVSTDLPHPGLPANWTIPPQGIELFEWYPSNATSVVLHTTGLPQNARWFGDVGTRFVTSNQTNETLFLPAGSYPLQVPPLGIPLGKNVSDPDERLAPFPGSSFVVGSTPRMVPVPFVLQWTLDLGVDPTASAGSVAPWTSWANASQPLTLTAVPAYGYHFTRWFGWGPGSTNGTTPSVTINATGPISEKAHFQPSFLLNFTETGLPAGTLWSLDVRGTNESSTNPSMTFAVSYKGLYGFAVGTVPGYRAHPPAGSVNVTTTPTNVTISFQKLTPPPPRYPVNFHESGLPGGTNWSVTVRGVTNSSTTGTIGFSVANGTYGFQVGVEAGYRSIPKNFSFTVNGSAVLVNVTFVHLTPPPPEYAVTFEERGLPNGTTWSVRVRNSTNASSTDRIGFTEANGTYGFNVSMVSGHRPIPRLGSFNVSGAAIVVLITFVNETPPPPVYDVTFVEAGLPNGTVWSVTVRGVTNTSSTISIGFSSSNGTYGFQVGPVAGFRSQPTNSSYTVNGSAVSETITFYALRPPLPTFVVTFLETGLLPGILWSVTVRNLTLTSSSNRIQLNLTNGGYGYQVGFESGYTRHPPSDGFTVAGGPVTVSVVYIPVRTTYDVVWKATGFWGNGTWWVLVNGTRYPCRGAWATASLHNGTYPYTIQSSTDFVASPRTGVVLVRGVPQDMNVTFVQASFSVMFSARGLPPHGILKVRLSDVLNESGEAFVEFALPNGTYTFDVDAPSGYFASPSHGNVTVKAAVAQVVVSFFPNGPGPIPSAWFLGARAASVGVVIVLAGWGGFALMRAVRLRRGRPPN
jgi:hypothetical protein